MKKAVLLILVVVAAFAAAWLFFLREKQPEFPIPGEEPKNPLEIRPT